MTVEEELGRNYYRRTASAYGAMHEREHSAHDRALDVLAGLLPTLAVGSLLDVGTGTGRALRALRAHFPDLALAGVEPVRELVCEAERKGAPAGTIALASAERLPFGDGSFDAVTAFGVLHHVPNPGAVIGEMLRVARRVVFISDSNRFAQGHPIARYLKLSLHALGLWRSYDLFRTRGRGYRISEGDGVYYSYSVFDSMRQLRAASSHMMTVELECAPVEAGLWSSTLTNASTVLVGAFKKDGAK